MSDLRYVSLTPEIMLRLDIESDARRERQLLAALAAHDATVRALRKQLAAIRRKRTRRLRQGA